MVHMKRICSDLVDSVALAVARALPGRVAKWCVVITLAQRPNGPLTESIESWVGEQVVAVDA
jgi:hypothetical protein